MKTYYVKDLKKGLILNNETFAIKSFEILQTKDNKSYFKYLLSDKTGEIKAQVWFDNLANITKGAKTLGNVIMINGNVEEYKGVLQINIFKADKVDESKLNEYIKSSSFDLEGLWNELISHIESINDDNIKKFLKSIFSDESYINKFKTHPGAEMVHHAYRGGLLEHTVEMIDLSLPLKKYYKEANFDYVITGIILHDIGKLDELEVIGVTTVKTNEGLLIGHVMKSYELLLKKGPEFLNDDQLLNIKHIVLSHHGYLEFGSPVLPLTIEANIVTYVDQMSSKTRIFQKVISNSNLDSDFSDFDRNIGGRIYLGNYKTAENKDELPFNVN